MEQTTTSPQVSILIPAYNEEKMIGEVLDRVHASFKEIGFVSYEVIVCDNNSTGGTGEIAAAHGALVVKEPHNQIARARNTAAKSARGKWFIFLDGDTFLTPQILGKTISTLEGGRICAGGCQLKFDRDDIGWFPAVVTGIWNRISRYVNLAAGSYLFCFREAWVETGGFDEEIYAGEEIYFSQKLKVWAKAHSMKFQILDGEPVVTSARKMDWYGQGELLRHIMVMMWPGSMRNKAMCGLWYTRPDATKPGNVP